MNSPAPAQDLLNEYAAAVLVGMSPNLLHWLTSYAPKHGLDRKLKIAKQEKGQLFFERAELIAFDNWLKLPWPTPPKASRPSIPTAIREELKVEAGGACAICYAHANSCEAAHLDPVHKSKNNHPENLLWLCANHHTVYDKGLFGPTNENIDFVASFKIALAFHKKQAWILQGDASTSLHSILSQCATLEDQLKTATTSDQIKAISKLANNTLQLIPKLAPISKADPNYNAFISIKPQIAELTREASAATNLSATLQLARKVRTEFVAAAGYVACPLCKGQGQYHGNDCPVCDGEREVREFTAKHADLYPYDIVDCPLCDGSGKHEGDDCPECGGEGEMQRRYAEQVDTRQYDIVDCPLCDGSGKHEGDDCRECGGEGEMPRRLADQVDTRQYDTVDCPLCDGSGKYEGDDCRECGGEGKMPRRLADQVDTRQYDTVDCPLCDGSGKYEGEDCRECGGEGKMPRRLADQVDTHQYKHVSCPACRGDKSHDCQHCDGTGTLPRWLAERME